jgi:hypothetical protein
MYDLFADGIRDIGRSLLFRKQKVSREPLVGDVDGSNVVFYTAMSPLLSSNTVSIYTSGSVVDPSAYEVDIDTGCIVLVTPPAAQPVASYTQVDLSTDQVKQSLFEGFQRLESEFQQGWLLSSGSSLYNEATGEEDHAYIVNSSTQDPVIGSTVFSHSFPARRALMCAVELIILQNRLHTSTTYGFSYREDRGIAVDKSKIPQNTALAIEQKQTELKNLSSKLEEAIYGDSALGGYISSPRSKDYENNFMWQEDGDIS